MSNNKLEGNQAIVVDVRSPAEYAGGFYPGAINIPVETIESIATQFGDKDREITLYCASGGRSSYALQVLQSVGYTNLTNGGGLMTMMSGLQ